MKALRVYERLGLIKPARSAKGYRLYGQKELVRLNAVATLKSVGLTLAQIRDAFETSSPRLPKVLRMQLDEWRTRKFAAEKAIRVVESALARVSARETLSIEELCQLIRSIEMPNLQEITRALINEALTPEEERAWATHYASLSPQEIADNKDHFEASRVITQELATLMQAGADPASAEVQALIERSNELSTRARFREGYLARLQWNAPLARKLLRLGQRLVRTTSGPPGSDAAAGGGDEFATFMVLAHRASKAGQALGPLLDEVNALIASGTRVDSAEAKAVTAKFAKICAQNNLGDPRVYAQWHVEFGEVVTPPEFAKELEKTRAAWNFLTETARWTGPTADT